MKNGLGSLFRATLFFLTGIAIAALAISAYGRTALFSLLGAEGADKDPGRLASRACVPESETDDIFFISCGGIY